MSKGASDLIKELGDYRAVADALGVPAGTVAAWKTRAAIPRSVWPEMVKAFPKVTFETLVATERAA